MSSQVISDNRAQLETQASANSAKAASSANTTPASDPIQDHLKWATESSRQLGELRAQLQDGALDRAYADKKIGQLEKQLNDSTAFLRGATNEQAHQLIDGHLATSYTQGQSGWDRALDSAKKIDTALHGGLGIANDKQTVIGELRDKSKQELDLLRAAYKKIVSENRIRASGNLDHDVKSELAGIVGFSTNEQKQAVALLNGTEDQQSVALARAIELKMLSETIQDPSRSQSEFGAQIKAVYRQSSAEEIKLFESKLSEADKNLLQMGLSSSDKEFIALRRNGSDIGALVQDLKGNINPTSKTVSNEGEFFSALGRIPSDGGQRELFLAEFKKQLGASPSEIANNTWGSSERADDQNRVSRALYLENGNFIAARASATVASLPTTDGVGSKIMNFVGKSVDRQVLNTTISTDRVENDAVAVFAAHIHGDKLATSRIEAFAKDAQTAEYFDTRKNGEKVDLIFTERTAIALALHAQNAELSPQNATEIDKRAREFVADARAYVKQIRGLGLAVHDNELIELQTQGFGRTLNETREIASRYRELLDAKGWAGGSNSNSSIVGREYLRFETLASEAQASGDPAATQRAMLAGRRAIETVQNFAAANEAAGLTAKGAVTAAIGIGTAIASRGKVNPALAAGVLAGTYTARNGIDYLIGGASTPTLTGELDDIVQSITNTAAFAVGGKLALKLYGNGTQAAATAATATEIAELSTAQTVRNMIGTVVEHGAKGAAIGIATDVTATALNTAGDPDNWKNGVGEFRRTLEDNIWDASKRGIYMGGAFSVAMPFASTVLGRSQNKLAQLRGQTPSASDIYAGLEGAAAAKGADAVETVVQMRPVARPLSAQRTATVNAEAVENGILVGESTSPAPRATTEPTPRKMGKIGFGNRNEPSEVLNQTNTSNRPAEFEIGFNPRPRAQTVASDTVSDNLIDARGVPLQRNSGSTSSQTTQTIRNATGSDEFQELVEQHVRYATNNTLKDSEKALKTLVDGLPETKRIGFRAAAERAVDEQVSPTGTYGKDLVDRKVNYILNGTSKDLPPDLKDAMSSLNRQQQIRINQAVDNAIDPKVAIDTPLGKQLVEAEVDYIKNGSLNREQTKFRDTTSRLSEAQRQRITDAADLKIANDLKGVYGDDLITGIIAKRKREFTDVEIADLNARLGRLDDVHKTDILRRADLKFNNNFDSISDYLAAGYANKFLTHQYFPRVADDLLEVISDLTPKQAGIVQDKIDNAIRAKAGDLIKKHSDSLRNARETEDGLTRVTRVQLAKDGMKEANLHDRVQELVRRQTEEEMLFRPGDSKAGENSKAQYRREALPHEKRQADALFTAITRGQSDDDIRNRLAHQKENPRQQRYFNELMDASSGARSTIGKVGGREGTQNIGTAIKLGVVGTGVAAAGISYMAGDSPETTADADKRAAKAAESNKAKEAAEKASAAATDPQVNPQQKNGEAEITRLVTEIVGNGVSDDQRSVLVNAMYAREADPVEVVIQLGSGDPEFAAQLKQRLAHEWDGLNQVVNFDPQTKAAFDRLGSKADFETVLRAYFGAMEFPSAQNPGQMEQYTPESIEELVRRAMSYMPDEVQQLSSNTSGAPASGATADANLNTPTEPQSQTARAETDAPVQTNTVAWTTEVPVFERLNESHGLPTGVLPVVSMLTDGFERNPVPPAFEALTGPQPPANAVAQLFETALPAIRRDVARNGGDEGKKLLEMLFHNNPALLGEALRHYDERAVNESKKNVA